MPLLRRFLLLGSLVLSFGSGPSAGQDFKVACISGLTGDCSSFVNKFCTTAEPIVVSLNDSISRCFMHPDGFRCDLNAWHATTVAQKFDTTTCENAMKTATASCVEGGSAIVVGDGTFVFTINPNVGKCADDSSLPDE